jgi:hypothetical protein
MLYKINAGGIETYCKDLIVDPETEQGAYFLSVSGYQTAVKGIVANLLKGEPLYVDIGPEIYWIKKVPENYMMKIKRLPSGYCNGIVLPRIAMSKQNGENKSKEFLLISKDPTKVKEQFFRHLDENIEIPFHPGWTDWLWELFETKEWITTLKTLAGNYEGYLISLYHEEVLQELTRAFRSEIPEVINCMERR